MFPHPTPLDWIKAGMAGLIWVSFAAFFAHMGWVTTGLLGVK